KKEKMIRKNAEDSRKRDYQSQLVLNGILKLSLRKMPFEKMMNLFLRRIISTPWFGVEKKGGIFIMDDAAGVLRLQAEYKLGPEVKSMCRSVEPGRCLCGRAAASGKLIFADKVDLRHDNNYAGMPGHGHYCVPIKNSSGNVLGVITLYVKEGHRPRDIEKNFLEAVADVIASVLERERMLSLLLKNEKMAIVGQLAAGITHDIRNPLAVISVDLGTMKVLSEDGCSPRIKERIDSIARQVDRINAIAQRLIYYSRGKRPKMTYVDIAPVLREVSPLLSHYPDFKGINWDERLPKKLPMIEGDSSQLREVFLNLCLNACQAVGKEGTVRIMAGALPKGEVEVIVSDDGGGFSKEDTGKIFEPFFTTKKEGTGLGLYTVKNIIDAHGGSIFVESEPGKGTAFRVVFPALKDQDQREKIAGSTKRDRFVRF
ncbi:MAG: ATP-binding protein, partial [Candidatus Omnitrophica bacterium]|nr:ATP-binding protein [Candidatus Omnitrophota bacterium]